MWAGERVTAIYLQLLLCLAKLSQEHPFREHPSLCQKFHYLYVKVVEVLCHMKSFICLDRSSTNEAYQIPLLACLEDTVYLV